MLSIYALRNSNAAASYYDKDDGYYTRASDAGVEVEAGDASAGASAADGIGEGASPGAKGGATATDVPPRSASGAPQGEWHGKGAEHLGLAGGVAHETFKAVLDGELPNGITLGTRKEGERQHRPGWDLTFSAPKSVSVVAEIGGDERVVEAHSQAVREALDYIEGHAAGYRQHGLLGVRERATDNIVVAIFQHDTNRNQEPNLHSHGVVANATRRPDGRWVSLYETGMYEQKMAAGNVYRANLARKLEQLGYETERTHPDGRFEIVGVPEAVAEFFSSRRQEIEQAMQDRGLEGAEAAAQAAVLTRSAKQDIPAAQLRPEWIAASQAQGFDAEAFVAQVRGRAARPERAEPRALDRAVREAIGRLSDTEAVFTKAELLRWVLANVMTQADLPSVEEAIARAQRGHGLIDTLIEHRPAWTTPQARTQERFNREVVDRSRGAVAPAASDGQVDAAVAQAAERARARGAGRGLNEGQVAAVRLITTTRDRVVGVLGRPGTGKTTMLETARRVFEAQGFEVRGMAANSEAARQIELDAGIPSGTIDRHLRRVGEDLVGLRKGDEAQRDQIRAKYAKQIWVVDEVSQVGSGKMRRMLYSLEALGARMVLIGDTQQLAAINAGKPFALMLRQGLRHVEMDEILRQRDERQRAAVYDAVAGRVADAMEKLAVDTTQIRSKSERLATLVAEWDQARAVGPAPIVLTATNADRTFLNDRMRDVLRTAGELRGETEQAQLFRVFASRADLREAEVYKVGDVVRFGRGAKALGIQGGDYFRVAAADRRRNHVTLVPVERARNAAGEQDRDRLDPTPIEWNPRTVAGGAHFGVELFRPRVTTLAPGEEITWSRNDAERGLHNGKVLTVVAAEAGKLALRGEQGEAIEVDSSRPSGRHWEHAHARTVYKGQGKTAELTLVNAEASAGELFNQKAFLVAISRQRAGIRLYTDDTERFTENVRRRLGDKTSQIESAEDTRFRKAALYLESLTDRVFKKAGRSTLAMPVLQPDRGRDPGPDPFS